MKYLNKSDFDKVNIFGTGRPNQIIAKYFIGNSFVNFLFNPGECPVSMANISFEPGSRTNWHIHHAQTGGGQMLICTAGEGWYQQNGKKAISLSEGSFVYIPAGVKHWHGAKADSWFSHISIEIPGKSTNNEWLETVADTHYKALISKGSKVVPEYQPKYTSSKAFKKANSFGTGLYNFMFRKYFSGRSYLKMLTMPGRTPLFLANVSFEPGCRNHWHVHNDGGQILICTLGQGWYQEEGKEARFLKAGDIVFIAPGVNHWHGASNDSWFSHIAISIPKQGGKVEWKSPVTDEDMQNFRFQEC